jgi:hypothetical protein
MRKSLEKLAAELFARAQRDNGATRATRADLYEWQGIIRAHLAARPASDLEQRLRDWADESSDVCERDLLLEAAEALAAQASSIGALREQLCRDDARMAARISELERELAELRSREDTLLSGRLASLTKRTEALEAQVATVRPMAEAARRWVTKCHDDTCDMGTEDSLLWDACMTFVASEQALATPAQPSEEADRGE